jgi:hemolysin activation/secretion protein
MHRGSTRKATVLSTAIQFLLPAAIVPIYAQEHEQEKQSEQKQKQAEPAQRQQQAKPAPQEQRGQEQQLSSRGAQPAAGHGSIPEAKFRSSFGSGHRFHVNRSEFANESGRFQYGGYWFNVVDPWPGGLALYGRRLR